MPIARISPGSSSYCCTVNGHPDCLSGSTISTMRSDSSQLQRMYCFSYHCNNNGNYGNHPCSSVRKISKCDLGPEAVRKASKVAHCEIPIITAHHIHKPSNHAIDGQNDASKKGTDTGTAASAAAAGASTALASLAGMTTLSNNGKISSKLTPYETVVKSLNEDERWQREITLGRRIGFYMFKNEIGTGNFSQVKVALHQLTKEKVAIKILDRSKLDTKTHRMLSREIASMEKLHHPNIVRLYEVIETFSKIYLVTEFANGGELYQKITAEGKMDEEEAKVIFAQIVAAVDHMHQHNIIHRDIKAENIFLTEGKIVKVGDFGFSLEISKKDDLLNTFCGSPPYAAPELFSDEKYVGSSVDLWAMGVLLYFMMTATMPFKAQTVSQLKRLIVDGDYSIAGYVSSDCQSVIKGLLQNEPKSRLSLSQLQKSRWLKEQKFPSCLPTYKIVADDAEAGESKNCSDREPDDDIRPMAVKVSQDEIETSQQLKELGIDETMLRENLDKGIRSNLIGTYRIVLHRVMASKYEADIVKRHSIGTQTVDSHCRSERRSGTSKNHYKDDYGDYGNCKQRKSAKSMKSIKSIFVGNTHGNDLSRWDSRSSLSTKQQPKTVKNNYIFGKKESRKKVKKHSKACTIL